MSESSSFWDRLAARTEPSGALVAMENPRSIVKMALVWTLGAIPGTALLALLFFWFDEPAAGSVQIALGFLYVIAWFFYVRTGSIRRTYQLLAVVSLVGMMTVHIIMGGYANSGAILMWGIPMATVAVLLLSRSEAIVLGGTLVTVAVIFGFLEQPLQASRTPPDPTLPAVLFPYTLAAVIVLVVPVISLLVNRLSFERDRAEGLLLNVLPGEVALELKETGATATQSFSSISVLFADIVGFTPMATKMEPDEMVDQLNEVFSHFDALAIKHGCEKIRTIGDAYMAAAGVPTPTDDHARAISSMALEMLEYARTTSLTFRFGINSGPVVAGVVGTSKFQYDIWGDTVNIASRMESHGVPGRIQISESTQHLIKDDFSTTLRGPIDVKGKGSLTTWFLEDHPKLQDA